MRYLMSILILLTLLLSCEKNKLCDRDSPTLYGGWIWLKSDGGGDGSTFTPELTGERITIEITADSTYREYLNKSLIIESKFSLAIDIHSGKPYLKLDGFIDQSYELIDCNNLILTDRVCGGFTKYYKRL